MDSQLLKQTAIPELGERFEGKVRDTYRQPGRLFLITTDRHSSFDRVIAHIPRKGEVLNRLSAYWFKQTADIVANHVISVPDPNVTIAKWCRPLPVEVVMRGYLTGVTSTSVWTHYERGRRDFGSFTLPEGMRKNQELPRPVFTPSTKEQEHDRTITPAEAVTLGLASREVIEHVEDVAQKLFKRGQRLAAARGFILVDTKYEFGFDENGTLTLIDEVHTPDSSRYWVEATYESRLAQRLEPESFDKEFLRLWFIEHCDPYADKILPEAPAEMVDELSKRYASIFHQLTGEMLSPLAPNEPTEIRIRRNLGLDRQQAWA
jgi:phosphoribosylaminoimidazole-succinocarboxamide synthase